MYYVIDDAIVILDSYQFGYKRAWYFLLTILSLQLFLFSALITASLATAKAGEITAAVLHDFPPLYTQDETGKPAGFAIDALEHVAKERGLTIRYLPLENWAKAMQAVRDGDADLIPGIGISPVRSAEFLFTEKVETIPVSCFVRASNHSIKGIDSLPGHRVAVIGKSAAETRLKPMQGVELVPFPNIEAALFQLMTGDVDAFVFPEPVLKRKMRMMNIGNNHIKVVGDPLMELKRGFLLRKRDQLLVDQLNPVIREYTQSKKYFADYQRWYGKPAPFWTVQRIIWGMSLILFVVLVVLISWRYYSVRRLNRRLIKNREQLRKDQALLRSLINSIPDIIFYKDRESVYLGCNKAFEVFTGKTENEIIGKTDLELFGPELGKFFRGKDQQMLSSGKAKRNDEWINYPDGHRILVDTLKTPYRTPGGEIFGLIGISRDITEKNHTEEVLRKREASLSEAQRLARIGDWELDLISNQLSWSDEIFCIFEIDKENFGASYEAFLDTIHPEDREQVNRAYTDSLTDKTPRSITHRLLMKDGSIKYVHEICKSVFDDKGNPIRSTGTIQDITHAFEVENALRKNQILLADAQKLAHLGNWTVDLITGQAIWSDEEFRLLGYEPGSVTPNAENFMNAIHPEDREAAQKEIQRTMQPGEEAPYHTQLRVLFPDNTERMVEQRGQVTFNGQGQPLRMFGTTQDITERKQSEQTLRRAQKMDAIGQLAGGIAHDFNNLLGIIIGNLDFLKYLISEDEKSMKRVDSALKAALRAADLTKQLLGFSRKQASDTHPIDVNQIIRGMESLITRSVTPEVEIEFHLIDNLWMTLINPNDLEDALLNLIINARDAMPHGGKLTIETSNRQLDTAFSELNPTIKPGDYIQLAVSDTGGGISREIIDQIFDPFFTTKSSGKGTGLGLSMVYGFTQRANGYIKAYSENNLGTTFRLYLPRNIEGKENISLRLPEEALSTQGHETILVVDDEDGLLDLARDYLEGSGYKVFTADRGTKALTVLRTESGIDLLFSDVVMPGGMNGYELAELACEKKPGIKVLLTSGFTKKASARNGQSRFGANLLPKPYNRNELLMQIRSVLDGEKR
ncbi:MAG: transporter substrate-binding domain-containing protein [Gammaproteobacteria bacterium]|nr:transporter substrate-binding domain-containing protein [Gammaproteobacteria bacterium]